MVQAIQMERQHVAWHMDGRFDLASRQAVLARPHQQPEYVEPAVLRQGRETRNGCCLVHSWTDSTPYDIKRVISILGVPNLIRAIAAFLFWFFGPWAAFSPPESCLTRTEPETGESGLETHGHRRLTTSEPVLTRPHTKAAISSR